MRADYLDRFTREYLGGFARLSREGAVFTRAYHGHVPTETAPGHATLATGCFPAQHGIVGNNWWDRTSEKPMYAVDDERHGRSPANLLCATLGDMLKSVSPQSRVASISGKDRAAILMGGRKADLVLWYEATAGQFISSSYYGKMPDWVWNWDARLRIPLEQRSTLTKLTLLDSMTLELARRVIEEESLGGRGVPDLLNVSLSVTDYLGHALGPDSIEMHDHMVALDRELGFFFDYLDRKIGKDEYVLVLASDHGVLPLPESDAGKQLKANRLSGTDFNHKLDVDLSKQFGQPPSRTSWVLDFSPPHLYLNMPLAKERGIQPERLRQAAALDLRTSPEVSRVFFPKDLTPGKKPSGLFAKAFQLGFMAERSGDLLVLFKEGVLFGDYAQGTGHGTPYDYDARVPLVFMGFGVRSGRYERETLASDLAPTLAHLLEIPFPPKTPNRVLEEVIQKGSN